MRFSHREDERDDRRIDILTDEENGLRIIISRLGAELISIAKRDRNGEWIGFLHRDDDITVPAKGWANHATVMGYYLHRLKDGRSLYRGHEIKGGTHSFLRNKTWHLAKEKTGKGSMTYRITRKDFSQTDYPLNVLLDLTYKIDNGEVNVTFHFTNHERKLTAHVGFGLHPGFAATSFEAFRFEMPAGRYRRHFSPGNYLSGEIEGIDFAGGEMPFSRDRLPGSYILEPVDVPQREFVYRNPPSGRSASVDLSDVPFLTLWSDGGPFLCIEPCWGLTDHHEQRPFEEKAGIQTIPPRGELRAGFTIKPRLTTAT